VFDDVDWAKMLEISAVAHPLKELAEASLSMLLNRLKEKSAEPPIHQKLKTHLVHRNSVINLSKTSK